ncbi:Nn.00g026470.m01.CDS01 [Neocucurbitaria sp. VM-36]
MMECPEELQVRHTQKPISSTFSLLQQPNIFSQLALNCLLITRSCVFHKQQLPRSNLLDQIDFLPQAPLSIRMSSPQALATDSMAHVVIPAVVQATHPQFLHFPHEILLEIFKHLLCSGRAIDQKYYGALMLIHPIIKLRRVSKFISSIANEAFYMWNTFKFVPKHFSGGLPGPWNESIPAVLPAPHLRCHLRRLHISIPLQDHYIIMVPEDHNAPEGQRRRLQATITTVEELFDHSPGARQLRTLTDNAVGFCRLRELDLHVFADFIGNHKKSLAAIAAAGFSVKAGKVQLSVTDRGGCTEEWHSELAKLIGVE